MDVVLGCGIKLCRYLNEFPRFTEDRKVDLKRRRHSKVCTNIYEKSCHLDKGRGQKRVRPLDLDFTPVDVSGRPGDPQPVH